MLVDEVEIVIKAGSGGSGAVSFRRNAQTPKGGPDGGNGGNGGDVYFQGVDDISSLRKFQYKKEVKAADGAAGKNNNLYGKNAQDLIIKIPFGTLVTNKETNQEFEIINDTDRILVAKGGIGGKGNNSFKTSTNQTPKFAEKGTRGEEKKLKLTLRLIADIGLIGLPNAGKSSILASVTNANPRIGNYPFTTLEPNLGVLDRHVIADIPGLIEGASQGKGLGFKFLKHIEKTKVIAHCISLENQDLIKSFDEVNSELQKYNPMLAKKIKLIVFTKSDLIGKRQAIGKIEKFREMKVETMQFSIFNQNDIQLLKEKFINFLENE